MISGTLLFGSALAFTAILPAAPAERQQLQVRLTAPVASYMKPGETFAVRVVGALNGSAQPVLPVGSLITGVIRKAHPIGYGIRREHAELELEFTGCRLPGGRDTTCAVHLVSVDNAREAVVAGNRIRGVLAASHPHSWLNGIWYRPTTTLLQRSAIGFTGAGGMIYTKLGPTPLLGAGVIAARLALFRMADSEIEIPAGADFVLDVTAQPDAQPVPALPGAPLGEEDLAALAGVPATVHDPDGRIKADTINFAFTASREQLAQAFRAAGWATAEPLTPRTFAKTYAAVTARKTYPNAPVSPLFYQGRLPDLVFQKSYNSLRKRHHIRLWRQETPAGPFWLGAATHDVAVRFEWQKFSFTHLIDLEIDKEQRTILNDLASAGCLDGLTRAERPWLARRAPNLEGSTAATTGELAVVALRACTDPIASPVAPHRHHRPWPKVAAARFFLETRHYLTRGSAYYWGYRSVRWTVTSLRRLPPPGGAGLPDGLSAAGVWADGAALCTDNELP